MEGEEFFNTFFFVCRFWRTHDEVSSFNFVFDGKNSVSIGLDVVFFGFSNRRDTRGKK